MKAKRPLPCVPQSQGALPWNARAQPVRTWKVRVKKHAAFELLLLLIRPKEWSWKREKAMLAI